MDHSPKRKLTRGAVLSVGMIERLGQNLTMKTRKTETEKS